ncbi:thiolase family protein [Atopobacter phocae]|uniref:thiolase family protein n=1 Tax=Atopobacter phocae TaxID=136492 RepID=UPI000471A07E|nr:thiolase family protein [Atopobacter phocae]
MSNIVFVAAKRTPIGRFYGKLQSVTPQSLAQQVVDDLLKTTQIKPEQIDQVIFGQVLQANSGQNIARQIALNTNMPFGTTAFTVNEVCGSGLKAIHLAYQALALNESDIIIAGGVESMSQAPRYMERQPKPYGANTLIDSIERDGLSDAFSHEAMGITAEYVASDYGVDRTAQDQFALQSQLRAQEAIEAGRFVEEITPVHYPSRQGTIVIDQDEHPRFNSTLAGLEKLRPAFQSDGSVTAGNSSGINDGASAVLMMREETARAVNLPILGQFVAFSEVGVDPNYMGISPILAIQNALKKAELSTQQIDRYEINEAFASQSVAVIKALDLPEEKVNPDGGAIALGHPIGASGARILVTLLHGMARNHQQHGVASLCVGGGQGLALVIKAPQ